MERTVRERARMQRVRVLLRTRNDLYPGPNVSGTPSTSSGPGRAEDLRKKKCPACDGIGKTRLNQKCSVCAGKGKYAVDSYIGRVSDDSTTIQRHMTPEAREAEIANIGLTLKLSQGEIDPKESYGWERAIEQRDKAGSYRELERCLEHLRTTDPLTWEHLVWIYSSGLEVEHSGRKEEEAVALLASWMPPKIKLPRHLARELAKQREDLIFTLAKKNTDLETIAESALCSVSTVRKIIGSGKPAENRQMYAILKEPQAAGAA